MLIVRTAFVALAVILISGITIAQSPGEFFVGTLSTIDHQVTGNVYLLSERVIEIRGFTYDGTAPAAYFWADTSPTPSSGGVVLSDGYPSNGCAVQVGDPELPTLDLVTQRVEFPDGITIRDFLGGSLSVWCEAFAANFGSIQLPIMLDESQIPQDKRALECASTPTKDAAVFDMHTRFSSGPRIYTGDIPIVAPASTAGPQPESAIARELVEFSAVALEGRIADASFNYKFNPSDSRAGGKDTISIIYEVPVLGWAGWGVSDNGGFMIGSEAVIGIPSTGEVLKYNLATQSASGVQPMPDEKQTLIDASISQENGRTTLTFTKILEEDGEIPINIDGDNTLISAWGSGDSLGYHAARGSYLLSGETLETRKQSLWKAHGWLAAIAWGAVSPLAIAISVLRQFFPGENLWFEFHRGLNMLVVVLTIAAFGIAVAAIQQETPEGAQVKHFDRSASGGHPLIGLLIFILAFVQGLGGFFRPHLPQKSIPTDEEDGKPETAPEAKSFVRVSWEVAHKGMGLGILGLCWYQVQLGIKSYATIFDGGDWGAALPAFWAVAGTLGAVILVGYVLKVVSLVKE